MLIHVFLTQIAVVSVPAANPRSNDPLRYTLAPLAGRNPNPNPLWGETHLNDQSRIKCNNNDTFRWENHSSGADF